MIHLLLYVLVLAALSMPLSFARADVDSPAAGDSGRASPAITEEQRRELERIGTLGYTVGGDRAPAATGVTVREDEAFEGYTVYVSADFPGAFLIDMDGRVLHSWEEEGCHHWTRAWVYPDGDILGVTAYPGRLVRMDGSSEGIWMYGDGDLVAHHDVTIGYDGRIYAIMRVAREWEWYRRFSILNDMVCVLEPKGETAREIKCVSIPTAFYESEYSDWVTSPEFRMKGPDPFHTNTIEVLTGAVSHPAFRKGNLLVTVRNMDCVAVIDPESELVVWANRGRWQRPHEARETPDGHLLLFDNRKFDGQSRVVKYDVVNDEILWSYSEPGFFSRGSGAQQLLPNGNVLITESQKGRVFEVTSDGRVVWEFWNPSTTDDGAAIVRITRAFRLPYDYFSGEFAERLGRSLR